MGLTAEADALPQSNALSEKEEFLRWLDEDQTFGNLMQLVTGPEKIVDIPEVEFRVEAIIGNMIKILAKYPDLAPEAIAKIKSKIDALNTFIEMLDLYATRMEMKADYYSSRASAARSKINWLMSQVRKDIDAAGCESVRGHNFEIRKVRSSKPSTVHFRDPGPADVLDENLSEFVKEIPTTYSWKNNEIQKVLIPFYKALENQPECESCSGRGKKVLADELMDCGDCVGTGKQLPDDIEVPALHSIAGLEWSHRLEWKELDTVMPGSDKPKKGKKKKA